VITEGQRIKFELVPYTTGVGLDLSVGTKSKLFRHWISKAETRGLDYEKLTEFRDGSLHFVFSSGVLERVTEQEKVSLLKLWWSKLEWGGNLCVLLETDDGKLEDRMGAVGFWDLKVKTEVGGLHLFVFHKIRDRASRRSYLAPVPQNATVVVRYGAIGDCWIMSSVLPGLKDAGRYVIANVQETGLELLRGNPHIDAFLVQDRDQLENDELTPWWEFLTERFGQVVNLCETMEGAVCTLPGRSDHAWPNHVRQKYLGARNYYEFAHDMAGVPLPPRPGFYPTAEERARAAKRRRDIGQDKFILLWVLAGSAVHKRLFQTDFVLGIPGSPGLLDRYPELHVIFVGDESCKILEAGWEGHPKVTRASGEWSVRETLAMLDQVDCVVGPETGIVNAAGISDVPTVVALSHTSEHTLCAHWKNYTALTPENVPCFPCYRLHYGNGPFCDMQDGAAACVRALSHEVFQEAIASYIEQAQRSAA